MIGVLMDQDQFFGEGVCNFKGDLLTQDIGQNLPLISKEVEDSGSLRPIL